MIIDSRNIRKYRIAAVFMAALFLFSNLIVLDHISEFHAVSETQNQEKNVPQHPHNCVICYSQHISFILPEFTFAIKENSEIYFTEYQIVDVPVILRNFYSESLGRAPPFYCII